VARRYNQQVAKLTLTVDKRIIERAKRHARDQGVSLSRLVERFLAGATDRAASTRTPPVLGRLRGSLRTASVADYRRSLEKKYL
jgi:hypothetical protein